jgi:hypothetical protein
MNPLVKSHTTNSKPDLLSLDRKGNTGSYKSIPDQKKSMIRIPNEFPTTHNLKNLLDKKQYYTEFINPIRNSYNDPVFNFHSNLDKIEEDEMMSRPFSKSRQVFSDDEYEERERDQKRFKVKNDPSQDKKENILNHINCVNNEKIANTGKNKNIKLSDYRGLPEFMNYMFTSNNYNFDSDSEKYKVYDSMTYGSDDSFVLDSSVIKETTPAGTARNGEIASKNIIPKTRNKSFVNVNIREESAKKNLSEQEDTICMQLNDYEDSIIFSEEVANVRPNFHSTKKNEIVIFNDKLVKLSHNPETESFLTKIKLSEFFSNIFKIDGKDLEKILLHLFRFDSHFALLLSLNLLDSENNCEKFITTLRENICNKELVGLILTLDDFKDDSFVNEMKNVITEKFFDSFDFEKSNIKESMRKCFQGKMIILNLFKIISQFSIFN